ncbi:hypothetical protein GGE07_004249 [Sinorhizobium terangae]|nr:hypothetical protein [Sinorhizobium terangae]
MAEIWPMTTAVASEIIRFDGCADRATRLQSALAEARVGMACADRKSRIRFPFVLIPPSHSA